MSTLPLPALTPHEAARVVYRDCCKRLVEFCLLAGALVVLRLVGPQYGLIGFALCCLPYLFKRPLVGLWVSPLLIMVASVWVPPEGFEWGIGYTPELIYWAIAAAILLSGMLVRYLWETYVSQRSPGLYRNSKAPLALYAFAGISLLAAILGYARGFSAQNVSKQFFGCVLFCAYFLFALMFASRQSDITAVLQRLKGLSVIVALLYLGIYLSRVPSEGFHKELTILSAYGGGLAVLFLPELFSAKGAHRLLVLVPTTILIAVPVLTRFRRAVAGFLICVVLAWGLHTLSRNRRRLVVAGSFLVFALGISTNLAAPIGRMLAGNEILRGVVPEDVTGTDSVYRRAQFLLQSAAIISQSPLLGTGLGSTLAWEDPDTGELLEQEFVEVGWLYLVIKFGIIGTVIFCWLLLSLGRPAIGKRLNDVHFAVFLLFLYFVFQLVVDPTFVYFMTAAWSGITCGFLHTLNRSAPDLQVRLPGHVAHAAVSP